MSFLRFVFAISTLALFIACASPSEQKKPALDSGAAIEQKSLVSAREAWQEKWDQTVTAAKKEGMIAVGITKGADTREALIKFGERYGIRTEITSGKSAQVTQKLLMERRVGLYLLDVMITGATTMVTTMKPAGAIVPLEPALIRQDILDPRSWQPGQPAWVDKDRSILTIEYTATGKIGINTNLVRQGEISTLRDLLNPKWKGKIIINDPTVEGTGSKLVGVVAYQQGWDVWREIAKQEPAIIRDERLMVEWLTRGKYAIIIAPKTDPIFQAKAAGAPVETVALKDARYLGGDTIVLLKNTPHPNAAITFINWMLSQEGQMTYHKSAGQWSARMDVSTPDSDPNVRPEPGVKYFDSNNEEFLLQQPEQMKMAQEIFGPLMK